MKKSATYTTAKAILLMLMLSAANLTMLSQGNNKSDNEKLPPVTVPNSEMRTFFSDILDQEMVLFIKLPPTYYSNPQKVYQGWYCLDANRTFPMVANIMDMFDAGGPVQPELLLIGIGYKIQDMGDWMAWRTRDLTPTNVPAADSLWIKRLSGLSPRQYVVNTGGAAAFLECIEKEVIPFVEKNYRVSPLNRGLGGYSYGGLFTLYTFFKKPYLFSIYYAGSPSISYDKGVLFTYEQEFASKYKDINAKLFMSAGEQEGERFIGNMNRMADSLRSHSLPGLTVETHVFPGEDHMSCGPSSTVRALRVLYGR